MFESVQEEKDTGRNKFGIALAVVAGVAVAGILAYTMATRPAAAPMSAAAPAAAAAKVDADPVHDLKIFRATMDKDRLGTTAVWSLSIENRSKVYTYTDIQYETSYIGADSKPLLVNQGKLPMTLGPGDQKDYELRDTLYPAGTSWYKFLITGATPSTP